MTKVFDDQVVERAFRAAERRLGAGDPDTLAGRFSPKPIQAPRETEPPATAARPKDRQPALSTEA